MTVHLSFSIGPVQGFVAQARRTRDLWAGSWLLSYLAECALAAAEADDFRGDAIIPFRSESDRGKITSRKTAVGGIPNRFELKFTGDDAPHRARAAAVAAGDAFDRAWRRVADAVWKKFVAPVAESGNRTREIWDRQVGHFWELSWVIGEPDEQQTIGSLAAMRKNLRNVSVSGTGESGTKCSLMPTFQELSGSRQRERQDNFWQALRKQPGAKGLNLAESERLCAIALIKRLFPHVIREAVGHDIGPELDQAGWPSTAFMAALPWLKSLSGEARLVAEEYQKLALSADYRKSERQAARDAGIDWAVADGPIWFASAVRNDELGRERLGKDPSVDEKRQRKAIVEELLDTLRDVGRVVAETDGRRDSPVPYYGLLLMDGDSMGELLGQLDSPQELSRCLGRFAGNVNGVVEQNLGRTIYAGGDDVLALVPAEKALAAAEQLCDQYRDAFAGHVASDAATISAAIIYAHWRYPLRQVLRTAHRLLDDVAKEQTGRDSVAFGIVPGSGLNALWSVPWSVVRGQADGSTRLSDLVAEHFGSSVQDEKAEFNASYLYVLRERFGRLFDDSEDLPGQFSSVPFDDDHERDLLRDLAHAEYRRRMSSDAKQKNRSDTEPLIDQLMSLSRRWKRNKPGEPQSDSSTFSFDGWRVARFLRQLQDGKVGDHD